MVRRLDVPQRVGHDRVLVARHLLLLVRPVWQLDLVREQVAPGERVTEAAVRLERLEAPPRLGVARVALDDLDDLISSFGWLISSTKQKV